MFDKLIDTISKTVTMTEGEIDLCKQYFEPVTITKNTLLEKPQFVPMHLYFISSGVARVFYVDEKGEEVTTYLSSANNFITSFLSFINQVKSTEGLESVTDCELLIITHANLKTLISASENFKKFSLIIFEHAISSTASRANDLATLTGEARYKKLMENHPALINSIPVQYIASYLGMQPESLSRIRRQINS